jgi:hypothetical protein
LIPLFYCMVYCNNCSLIVFWLYIVSTDTSTTKRIVSLSTGQRFAVLEEKVVLSSVLRKYKLESVDKRENIEVMFELILRPKHGLRIKITPR